MIAACTLCIASSGKVQQKVNHDLRKRQLTVVNLRATAYQAVLFPRVIQALSRPKKKKEIENEGVFTWD